MSANKKKILLTGATGFVGEALTPALTEHYDVVCVHRNKPKINNSDSISHYVVGNYNESTDFTHALDGIDTVVHVAARAHVLKEKSRDPQVLYNKINRDATINLAKQAAASGVRRFIFISSIKVFGESSEKPLQSFDKPLPEDPYGRSKLEAELGLQKVSIDTGMEFVIIRPPLIYGKNVRANFGILLKLARKNLPLPLGSVKNQRSIVSLHNLVDLILCCVEHPKAANEIFLVSDGKPVSTSDLLRKVTIAAGNRPRLFPFPVSILRLLASLVGKRSMLEKLTGNLCVDISHTERTLSWKPPFSLDDGLKKCFER